MKLAIISRGVSGSGKSTFNRKLSEVAGSHGLKVAVHCTDDLFMVGDEYRFDPALLGRNHMQNLRNFEDSLNKKIDIVVCDNTNTSRWEWKKYAKAAQDADYALMEIYFEPGSIDTHEERNAHSVPRDVLEKQKEKLLSNPPGGEEFGEYYKIKHENGEYTFEERMEAVAKAIVEE